jgi:predicted PurR-regulated permease PerM
MELIIIAILFCTTVFFIVTTIKALNKIEVYKQYIEDLETFILNMQSNVTTWVNQLYEIDKKGSFEADDEVGVFFKNLKKLMTEIKDYVFDIKEYTK